MHIKQILKVSTTPLLLFLLSFSIGAFASEMTLSSPEIKPFSNLDKQQVFNGFGCTGDNISPSLSWKNAPKGTQSFVLMAYDPDAPTGSGWWHWVVFNIPADIHHLKLNAGDLTSHLMPKGAIQSRTDFGKPGYGGACPPKGDKAHRYQFTLFALKVKSLPLDKNASAASVGFYARQNMLSKATLIATYRR